MKCILKKGALLFSLLLPAQHFVHHHADCWNHSGDDYFLKIPPQGSPVADYKDRGYAAAPAIELYKFANGLAVFDFL